MTTQCHFYLMKNHYSLFTLSCKTGIYLQNQTIFLRFQKGIGNSFQCHTDAEHNLLTSWHKAAHGWTIVQSQCALNGLPQSYSTNLFFLITIKSAVTKPTSFCPFLASWLWYISFYCTNNQSIASDNTINTGLLTPRLFMLHCSSLLNLPAIALQLLRQKINPPWCLVRIHVHRSKYLPGSHLPLQFSPYFLF